MKSDNIASRAVAASSLCGVPVIAALSAECMRSDMQSPSQMSMACLIVLGTSLLVSILGTIQVFKNSGLCGRKNPGTNGSRSKRPDASLRRKLSIKKKSRKGFHN